MNKIIEYEDNNSQGSNNSLTSNSENPNENNKREKRTRNRLPRKFSKFSGAPKNIFFQKDIFLSVLVKQKDLVKKEKN